VFFCGADVLASRDDDGFLVARPGHGGHACSCSYCDAARLALAGRVVCLPLRVGERAGTVNVSIIMD
jgi:hypothetical protein